MRFRHTFIIGGSLAAIAALLLTDPDGGSMTAIFGVGLIVTLLAVLLAHWSRKALFDYLDLQKLATKAAESPEGAGRVFMGVCIVIGALLLLYGSAARAQVPAQALEHLPTLRAEIRENWPGHPMPAYFGGLIEHESACPRKRSCWRPTAQLKSAREEGAGLGQLTRAYRADGSIRFDALAEMRAAQPALRELDWATIYQRPDLQLRAVVLKSRADWMRMPDAHARLEFTDLAYNAGRGRVAQDRRACGLKPGCDPDRWHGHVERTCTASRSALYGTRSACDISRHHVHDVFARAPKYGPYLGEL